MLTIEDALKYPTVALLDYTLSETQPFKHKNVLALMSNMHGNISKCKLVLRSTQDLTVFEEGILKAKCMYEQSMGGGLIEIIQAYGKGQDYLRSIGVDVDEFIKKNKAIKNV